MSAQAPQRRLHVLIANENVARLAELDAIVRSLGHDTAARETDPTQVAQLTREHRPDIALVGLGQSSEHALTLIKQITRESACPVITVLRHPDPDFVAQAALHGVFASINHDDLADYRSAIEIALARFAAFRNLEGAFGRRARIERAKGILMERHQTDEHHSFELLRNEARRTGHKLADIAAAINDSHTLLPARTPPRATGDKPAP